LVEWLGEEIDVKTLRDGSEARVTVYVPCGKVFVSNVKKGSIRKWMEKVLELFEMVMQGMMI
jgi:hypothetical protein